jgi:antitoxin component of MazEF toxin-antitoxin module
MALVKRFTRHGNSAGLIFDQPIMKQMGWDVGSEVEIRVQDEKLILTSHRYADDNAVKEATKRMIKRHRKSLERLSR